VSSSQHRCFCCGEQHDGHKQMCPKCDGQCTRISKWVISRADSCPFIIGRGHLPRPRQTIVRTGKLTKQRTTLLTSTTDTTMTFTTTETVVDKPNMREGKFLWRGVWRDVNQPIRSKRGAPKTRL
jgi:hypothetical protein